jgi:hypothetical protein
MTRDELHYYYECYGDVFDSCNIEGLMPFYHLPCMLVGEQRVVALTETNQLREALEQQVNEQLAFGYKKCVWDHLSYEVLTPRSMMTYLHWTIYGKNNRVLWDFCASYSLRKIEQSWKFVSVVTHGNSYHDEVLKHCC